MSARERLGQAALNAMLRSQSQPNSGGLALEIADALLPTVNALIADELEEAAQEIKDDAETEFWHGNPALGDAYFGLLDRAKSLRAEATP